MGRQLSGHVKLRCLTNHTFCEPKSRHRQIWVVQVLTRMCLKPCDWCFAGTINQFEVLQRRLSPRHQSVNIEPLRQGDVFKNVSRPLFNRMDSWGCVRNVGVRKGDNIKYSLPYYVGSAT